MLSCLMRFQHCFIARRTKTAKDDVLDLGRRRQQEFFEVLKSVYLRRDKKIVLKDDLKTKDELGETSLLVPIYCSLNMIHAHKRYMVSLFCPFCVDSLLL
jgi:hypothetical protein